MKYAIIENNEVINVTLWDGVSKWSPPEGTIAVACPDEVGPGWTYNGSTFSPPAPAPVVAGTYTRIQFLFLFTPEEIIAIQDAAVTNQTVMYYNYMVNAVVTLQLTDTAVINGVNMLATQGVITPERAAQILAGDPAPIA